MASLIAFLTPAQREELRPHGTRVGTRVAAGMTADAILEKHAPELAKGIVGALLSPAARKAMLADIATISPDRARIRVHGEIDQVILEGNAAGTWQIESLGICAQHLLAPSRIVAGDEVHVERILRWREALRADLPRLMRCEVAAELAGAVEISAAIFDAQINDEMVPQLLHPESAAEKLEGATWVCFHHGAAKDARGQPRCRRAVLSPVTTALLGRWHALRGDAESVTALPACVALAGKRLGMHGPRSLVDLLRSARAYWALHLSPIAYDAALVAGVTESLPNHVLKRLLSGRALHPRDRTISRREALRSVASNRAQTQLGTLDAFSKDTGQALAAFRQLRRIFWIPRGQRKPRPADIALALQAWSERFDPLGGWVALLGRWAAHLGSSSRTAGNGKPLDTRSIHTFVSSFGRWFLMLAGDLSPAEADGAEFLDRLDVLQLVCFGGASTTGRRAFAEFLVFSERFGVPRVDLVDRWGALTANGRPDANLLTPAEFRRLLDAIDDHFQPYTDCFACRRVRALAILAYRTGMRWSELQVLPLRHVRDRGEAGYRETSILVLKTEFGKGKSANAERALPLEKLLPSKELTEVRGFLSDIARGVFHPPSAGLLVFSDPRTPSQPPAESDTRGLIQRLMREVTGDYTLVFHHLRHSAATLMLLRVLGSAERVMVPTLADDAITLPPGFASHAHWLTGRPDGLHSAATAVAKLLGHIDFQVTCFHYVHLMELVISHETRRTHLPLSDKALAAIQGVNTATIYQRRWLERRAQ